MKKMKITLAERIAALVVAIALLAGMAPDALLRVSAETENHEGMYTLAVCDAQGEPLAGAEISWVICDEAGNNEAEQEKKTSGEDGVCELGEISTALGETEAGVEKVYYKITGINKFGYIYSTAESQNIYEVEKADRNSHREIRLTEKEKGTLTGKIETTEGAGAGTCGNFDRARRKNSTDGCRRKVYGGRALCGRDLSGERFAR